MNGVGRAAAPKERSSQPGPRLPKWYMSASHASSAPHLCLQRLLGHGPEGRPSSGPRAAAPERSPQWRPLRPAQAAGGRWRTRAASVVAILQSIFNNSQNTARRFSSSSGIVFSRGLSLSADHVNIMRESTKSTKVQEYVRRPS